MTRLASFIKANKEAVYRLAEENTTRNEDGKVVITNDDNWRQESEWDEVFEELRRNN